MPLSKRKKGEATPLAEGVLSRVQLSPYRVQLAGIKTVVVEHRPLVIDVRALGVVAVDERKLSRIVVRAIGYVEKLFVNESFTQVSKGQPLAEIYSPEIYTAAGELLIARSGQAASYLDASRRKLELLGLADEEIDEIIRTGKVNPAILIRSPQNGHVFEKRIVEGDSLQAGQTLFEVADLSTVWVEGELYEKDAVALETGANGRSVASKPIRAVCSLGHVSLIHPHVETSTRTLRVRCEVDNRHHELRPGMFATLQFKTPIVELEPFRSELAAYDEWQELSVSGRSCVGAERDESLAAFQKTLPGHRRLSSAAWDRPMSAVAGGHIVMLCCPSCKDKLAARPDYYLDRLNKVTDRGVLAVPEQSVIDTGDQIRRVRRTRSGRVRGRRRDAGPAGRG